MIPELRYDVPAREPDEDLVGEWAVEISETEGFHSLVSLAEDFYSEAEDELEPDALGYNMGLAAGKADEDFSVDDDSIRALRYGLGSSAGNRGDDRVRVVDLFGYGRTDFEELKADYEF
jgi:hypothetical protein